jgi:PPOX class probable F420-dependent enzyme
VSHRELFASARVARLATAGPHIVPICFAVDGDTIWSAVDAKPKRTRSLQRLENIAADPHVAVLADHYDEDWSRLWWVRADGVATVHDSGPVDLLAGRYPQYAAEPPAGPFIAVAVERWSGWSAV